MTRWLLLALLLIAESGRVAAQEPEQPPPAGPGDAVKNMVGAWEFTNSGRDKKCTVRFRNEPAASGMKVEFDRNCATLFAFVTGVVGWTISENDFLKLIDARGQPVMEFSEVESGIFEAPKQGEGILFIQKPTVATTVQRTAADLAGEWVIARENRTPICTLGLATTPAGADLALRVTPPCDVSVTRFGPTAWQLDGEELVLKSARGQTWRFEENEDKVWRRVQGTANPILLLRK